MAGLSALNRKTAKLTTHPRELIQQTFGYASGFLAPIQVEEEISLLFSDAAKLRPRAVLEIGTSMGGTFYLWTRAAAPDAILVSVDLPGGKFGGGYSSLRTPLYRRFARERQTVHLLRADSHSPETARTVKSLFQDRPVDFLFIDGDHTYEGALQDWKMYGPMVRPGGLVAFHDVAMNYQDTQVKKLWDEIRGQYQYREYLVHPKGFYGIGVLQR